MGRRKRTAAEILRPRPQPIEPTAVYRRDELPTVLRLGAASIHEAIQDGSLRFTKRGKRQLFLGQWLLDWLSGPMPAQVPDRPASTTVSLTEEACAR